MYVYDLMARYGFRDSAWSRVQIRSHRNPAWPRHLRATRGTLRGLRDRINIRILHSHSEAQVEGESKSHGLQKPDVYVVFGP